MNKKLLQLAVAPLSINLGISCNPKDTKSTTAAADTVAPVTPSSANAENYVFNSVVPDHVTAAVSTAKSMTQKAHHYEKKTIIKNPDAKGKDATASIVFLAFVPDVEAPPTPPPPAATPAAQRPQDKEGYHFQPDKRPSFPGGDDALNAFLEKKLEYPDAALEAGVEGTVLLRFSVDEFGKVYPPRVISKPLGYGLEEEAISAVEKMPGWNPGTIRNEIVKTRFTLPVRFEIRY